MAKHSHGPLIERAAQIVGGDSQLREFLCVTPERYALWRDGAAPLPWDLFLKTVDLLSDFYDGQIRRARMDGIGNGSGNRTLLRASQLLVRRSTNLLDSARQTQYKSRSAVAEARQQRGLSIVLRGKLAAERLPQGKQPSVRHPLFDPGYVPATRGELMEAALDAALTVARTDLGDLQILDGGGRPQVEAHRGFPAELIQALSTIEMGLSHDRPVFVPDLATDPVFSSTREGEAIMGAGARALAYTPIVHNSGLVVGAISTHYREPLRKDAGTLALLQLVGRRTAGWLDAKLS